MMTCEPDPPLSYRLRRAWRESPGETVALGPFLDRLGDHGHASMLIVLGLPAIIPTPGIPLGTLLGLIIMVLGAHMILGEGRPKLPGPLARLSARRPLLRPLVSRSVAALRRFEAWLKPKAAVSDPRPGGFWLGPLVVLLGFLIALPIPFGNLLPGLAVAALGAALAWKSERALALGAGLSVLSLLAAGLLAAGGLSAFDFAFGN